MLMEPPFAYGGILLAPKKPLLEQMRANPRAGWTTQDIKTICEQYGIEFQKPTRGSHHKAVSPLLVGHLTIPHARPIKPFYIRNLISMIEAHILAEAKKEE